MRFVLVFLPNYPSLSPVVLPKKFQDYHYDQKRTHSTRLLLSKILQPEIRTHPKDENCFGGINH